jgi:hypothetical protein
MKKTFLILAIFLPTFAFSAFNQTQWIYYKDFTAKGLGNTIVKFPLDEEIFAGAKDDLSDLRVATIDGNDVPYTLLVERSREDVSSVSLKITNNSSIKGVSSSAILEAPQGKTVNRLHITTADTNFRRNVKVYGSADQKEWSTVLDNGYIYDYTDVKGNFHSQDTTIEFSDSTFAYLKIEISDNEGAPIKIASVEASERVKRIAREVSRTPAFTQTEDTEHKESVIIADSLQRGIPVAKASLAIGAENFNRAVFIYSGNDGDKWNFLGQEYIFRYRTPKFSGEKLAVQFRETNDRYLKIVIQNKDDAPLAVTSVQTFAVYREVAFQAEAGKMYRVYYGNKNARAPEYDFEKYFQYLDTASAVTAALSPQKNNEQYIAPVEPKKPVSERYPHLLSAALVFAGLILLFLVYKFLKTPPPAAPVNTPSQQP